MNECKREALAIWAVRACCRASLLRNWITCPHRARRHAEFCCAVGRRFAGPCGMNSPLGGFGRHDCNSMIAVSCRTPLETGAAVVPRHPPRYEKRKQGQSPASMRSQSAGHLQDCFYMEWLRFIAPPVFLPQTWTATSGAQDYCADALHSADKLLLPYCGPICHHGCRALHHKSSRRRQAAVFAISEGRTH